MSYYGSLMWTILRMGITFLLVTSPPILI